ncbi:hypothetical protein [Flavihumibacter petaseus]|nr:hypothetical protein [Flavihumibacter petaseus]
MKLSFLALMGAMVVASCGSEGYSRAEDAQDAGREFIRASLDGNIPKAEFYLLKDSANLMVFETWKAKYRNLSAAERVSYQEANILPSKIENINDSTVSFTYSNSYKNSPTTLKIVRIQGEWLVDLKDIH